MYKFRNIKHILLYIFPPRPPLLDEVSKVLKLFLCQGNKNSETKEKKKRMVENKIESQREREREMESEEANIAAQIYLQTFIIVTLFYFS